MRIAPAVFLLLALNGPASADCPCPLPDQACPKVTAGAPKLGAQKPVQGVFVAFDEGVNDWDAELARLTRCAGVTTVIIQSAAFDPEEAKELLRASKGKPVDVYVGLHYSGSFSAGKSNLKQALRDDKLAVKRIMSWPAEVVENIDGWYIAHELHNFQIWKEGLSEEKRLELTWSRAEKLRNYLAVLTRYLKDKKDLPVVISPHFNPTVDGALLSAAYTSTLFETMFRNTGIDMVLLQDGLGARNEPARIGCCRWARDAFEAQAYVYERAVQTALTRIGVKFGVNVESFEFDENACVTRPAKTGDFGRQRQLVPGDAAMVASFSLKTLWEALGNPCPP